MQPYQLPMNKEVTERSVPVRRPTDVIRSVENLGVHIASPINAASKR